MRYISAQFSTEDGMDLILTAMDNANSQIESIKAAREDIIEGSGKSKEATDFLSFLSEFQSRQEQLLEFLLSGMNDFIGKSVDVSEPPPPPEPEEEEE
jgi:hypothetical protein